MARRAPKVQVFAGALILLTLFCFGINRDQTPYAFVGVWHSGDWYYSLQGLDVGPETYIFYRNNTGVLLEPEFAYQDEHKIFRSMKRQPLEWYVAGNKLIVNGQVERWAVTADRTLLTIGETKCLRGPVASIPSPEQVRQITQEIRTNAEPSYYRTHLGQ